MWKHQLIRSYDSMWSSTNQVQLAVCARWLRFRVWATVCSKRRWIVRVSLNATAWRNFLWVCWVVLCVHMCVLCMHMCWVVLCMHMCVLCRRLGQPELAEQYLVDTVRMYANDGWPSLHLRASEMLARCYKEMCNIRKWACDLSCAHSNVFWRC